MAISPSFLHGSSNDRMVTIETAGLSGAQRPLQEKYTPHLVGTEALTVTEPREESWARRDSYLLPHYLKATPKPQEGDTFSAESVSGHQAGAAQHNWKKVNQH